MHVCHTSTRSMILGAYAVYHTWRKTARKLGYNENAATILNQVAAGKSGAISPEKEDELRERLGLFPIYGIRVAPCPTCGIAHVVGDCHGKDGEPIIKAANEELRLAPLHPIRQRQHRIRREMTAAQATIWDNLNKEEKDERLGIE